MKLLENPFQLVFLNSWLYTINYFFIPVTFISIYIIYIGCRQLFAATLLLLPPPPPFLSCLPLPLSLPQSCCRTTPYPSIYATSVVEGIHANPPQGKPPPIFNLLLCLYLQAKVFIIIDLFTEGGRANSNEPTKFFNFFLSI